MRAASADTERLHKCKHCQSERNVLHKHSGSALTFPQAPFQSWPGLLGLSQVRVRYKGMLGLHSSMGYATNHILTTSHRNNTE